MKKISQILDEVRTVSRPTNLHKEFQQYGVYIAEQLEDTKHYSLYIKLCKDCPRILIEEALSFVKGYANAKNKGRVFMWKLNQLKKEKAIS